MRRVLKILGVTARIMFFLVSSQSLAYTPTLTPAGVAVRWANPHFNLAGNPQNQSGLSAKQVQDAVVRGLERWKAASNGSVDFSYWQGTDASIYIPNSEYNGLSSIYFASHAQGSGNLSSNILGLTQVWYSTDNGQILEADTILNDKDFNFTTNPKDTSGYGSGGGNYSGGRTNVYIENVITHELGHSYGLSHSASLQATMLYMESPEQAHLSCDENLGMHALYPSRDSVSRGAITGTVVTDSAAAVFGAHVLAISRRRGAVLASAMTDHAGHYTVSGLEAGAYFLMVEPYYAGAQSLPAYYSGSTSVICSGGHSFGRSILAETGSKPMAIGVSPSAMAQAPNLVARCDTNGAAAISGMGSSSSVTTAPVVYNSASDGSGFGVSDQFNYGTTNHYRLQSVSGHIEIRSLAYSLYSPIRTSLTLLDSAGHTVAAQVTDRVYTGDSGYVNYDAALVADVSPGDYTVAVTAANLSPMYFPAGNVSIDSVPFLMLAGSVNEAAPSLASTTPFNARCRMDESFAAYASPPGNPPRENTDGSGIGFCGTVSRSSISGTSGPRSARTEAILGWLLPFGLMGLISRSVRYRVRRSQLA